MSSSTKRKAFSRATVNPVSSIGSPVLFANQSSAPGLCDGKPTYTSMFIENLTCLVENSAKIRNLIFENTCIFHTP